MGQEPRESDSELPQMPPFKERVRPKALNYCRPRLVVSTSYERPFDGSRIGNGRVSVSFYLYDRPKRNRNCR
jgi:hypothetical protein